MKAYILIGAPGSGKSTWSKDFLLKNPNVVRLSHDEMKAKLGSSEEDITVANQAYAAVRRIMEESLAAGNDVMIDMTNMWRSRRKDFVQIGRKYNATLIAVVFEATRETCNERIAKRVAEGGRNVSAEVIDMMISKYYPPDKSEFNEIMFISKI